LNSLGEIFVSERNKPHSLYYQRFNQTLIKKSSRSNVIRYVQDDHRRRGKLVRKFYVMNILSCLPDVELYNEYGPTEATVWATVYKTIPAESEAKRADRRKPISNCQIYILRRKSKSCSDSVFRGGVYL
jgi:hypothetical protein